MILHNNSLVSCRCLIGIYSIQTRRKLSYNFRKSELLNDKRLTPFTRFFNISFSKFSKWLWVCRFNNPISFRQSDEKLIFIAKNCFIFFQGKTSEKKTLPENGLTLFLSIKKKKIVVKSKQTVYCKILWKSDQHVFTKAFYPFSRLSICRVFSTPAQLSETRKYIRLVLYVFLS